jgi:hypothetical protein
MSVRDLSKVPPVFPDGGGRTSENSPEIAIHVALVAEPCLKCDGSIWFESLAQEARRAFDTEPSSSLLQPFSGSVLIG